MGIPTKFLKTLPALIILWIMAACTQPSIPSQAPSTNSNEDQTSSEPQSTQPIQPENPAPPVDTASSTQMNESVLKVILAAMEAGKTETESLQQTIASLELEKSKTANNEDSLKTAQAQLDMANATLEALKKNNADLQAKYDAEQKKQAADKAAAAAAKICNPDQDVDGVYESLPDSCASVPVEMLCGYSNFSDKDNKGPPPCTKETIFAYTDVQTQTGTVRQYRCCFDNCPSEPNSDQIATYLPGIGNACIKQLIPPPDRDLDEIPDNIDNCPDIPNPGLYVTPDNGTNGEIGDGCNWDMDGDGIFDKMAKLNADGDLELVLDPDTHPHRPVEILPEEFCGNVKALYPTPCTKDLTENCCYDNCQLTKNPTQINVLDTEQKGIGDACNEDRDGDKVPNEVDNCPDVPNPNKERSFPKETKFGDACNRDIDNDGAPDKKIGSNGELEIGPDHMPTSAPPQLFCGYLGTLTTPPAPTIPCNLQKGIFTACCYDNCPTNKNGDCTNPLNCNVGSAPSPLELAAGNQADYNSDGVGDACTSDIDGDRVENAEDLCPYLASIGRIGDSRLCDGQSGNHGILTTVLAVPKGGGTNRKDFAADPPGFYTLQELGGFDIYSTPDYTNYYVAQKNAISTFKIKPDGGVDTEHSAFADPTTKPISTSIGLITAIKKVPGQQHLLFLARNKADSKNTTQLWSIALDQNGLVVTGSTASAANVVGVANTARQINLGDPFTSASSVPFEQMSIGIKMISPDSTTDCNSAPCPFVAFISSPGTSQVFSVRFNADMSLNKAEAITLPNPAILAFGSITEPRSTFVDGNTLYIGVLNKTTAGIFNRLLRVSLDNNAVPDPTRWFATPDIPGENEIVGVTGFAKVPGIDNFVFFGVSLYRLYAIKTDGTVIQLTGWGYTTAIDPNASLPVSLIVASPYGMAADNSNNRHRLLFTNAGTSTVMGIDLASPVSNSFQLVSAAHLIGQWGDTVGKVPLNNPWTFDRFDSGGSVRVLHDSGPMSYVFATSYYSPSVMELTFKEHTVVNAERLTSWGFPKKTIFTRYTTPNEWRLYYTTFYHPTAYPSDPGLYLMRIDKKGKVRQASQIWKYDKPNSQTGADYTVAAISPNGKKMFMLQSTAVSITKDPNYSWQYPQNWFQSAGPNISMLNINPVDGCPVGGCVPVSQQTPAVISATSDGKPLPWKFPTFIDTYHDQKESKDYLLVVSNDYQDNYGYGWGGGFNNPKRSDIIYRAEIAENTDGTVSLKNAELLAGNGDFTAFEQNVGIGAKNVKFTELGEVRYFDGNIWIAEVWCQSPGLPGQGVQSGPNVYRYDLKTKMVYRVLQQTRGNYILDGEFDVGAGVSSGGAIGFDFLQFGTTKGLLLNDPLGAIRLLR